MPLWLHFLRLYGRYWPIARGKGHNAKWAYTHFPQLRHPVIAPIARNIRAEFYPWLWADFCSLVIGGTEIYTLAYFRSLVRSTSIVFDIGAYIGAYTFTAAEIATAGSIHVFEPNPQSAQRLRQTINNNGLTNVLLNECAIGDQSGVFQFHLHKTPTESGLVNVEKTTSVIDIPVQTIDKYCQNKNIPKVDLLKIDVEGAELLVLHGATRTIRESRPIMIVELHRKQSTSFGYTVEDTVQHLQSIGYTLFTQFYGLTTRPRLVPLRDLNWNREIVIAKPV